MCRSSFLCTLTLESKMSLITILGIALGAYLAGMLGSVAYAFVLVSKVPSNPGGENKMFALVFAYMLIKEMQLPKLLVCAASTGLAVWLCSSACAAAGLAAAICFFCSALPFAYLAHRANKRS